MKTILLFSALQANAAAPPAALPVAAREEVIVVTATRAETPVSKVGSSVTVIDDKEIERSQENFVSELLTQIPGVSFSRNGGVGGLTSVRIRGAEAEQTALLIDGIKINDPSSPGGGFNFANLLTRGIQRIEVLRGPQSTLWGSQAIGGVVNVITAAPGAERTSFSVEGGSRDTAQLRGETAGKTGRLGYVLGGGYFRTDGVSALSKAFGGTEPDGYRNYGANGRLTYDISDSVDVDIRGWFSAGRNEFDVAPRDTADFGKTREVIGYAGLNARAFDGRLRNRFSAALTRTKRDNFNPTLAVPRTFDALGRNKRFEYQGQADLGEGIEAVFGAETEQQEFRSLSPTVKNPNPAPAVGEAKLNSIYGQLQAEPLDGLTLTGGVRRDEHSRFGGATTGRVTAAFTPDQGRTVARTSYGTGFKAPTLFQLLSDFGNLELNPERGRGWDAGIERSFAGERVKIAATYFGRRSDNLIEFVSCFRSSDLRCRTRPQGFYDNVRRTKVRGVEFSAAAQPLRNLLVRGQYTLTDAENASPGTAEFGKRLARRPKHSGFAELVYSLPMGIEGSVAVTVAGASFDDALNRNRLDDYTLVDARLRYHVTERLQLFGRVENVFDEVYETTRRFGSPGRGAFVGASLGF
jgi:vitamin B12 transporter